MIKKIHKLRDKNFVNSKFRFTCGGFNDGGKKNFSNDWNKITCKKCLKRKPFMKKPKTILVEKMYKNFENLILIECKGLLTERQTELMMVKFNRMKRIKILEKK
jgi:hypothetical protein